MKKTIIILFTILLLCTTAFIPLAKEDPQIEINLRRDFGYGGFGEIQGTFTISADAPGDVVRLEFLLNSEVMAELNEAPWKFTFNTDAYNPGESTFSAIGYTSDGRQYSSNTYTTTILSGDDAMSSTMKLVIPLLGLVLVIVVVSALVPLITGKNKKFELGKYGAAGGAVCRSCSLPFSRNVLAPNLVVGKLERCPHCGKWMIAPRAGQAALQEAEQRYLADKKQGNLEVSAVDEDKDKLRQMLDDSRFDE